MDPSKLETITSWPYPQNLKQLNRFLGFSNFYRRFVLNFSTLAAPLHAITHSNVDVVAGLSSPRCVSSFQSLIQAFSSAPVLSHFDFCKPRVLQVDCSGFALSAILSQPDASGILHPVSFLS